MNFLTNNRSIISQSIEETTDWIKRHSIEINDAHLRQIKRDDSLEVYYLTKEQRALWKEAVQPVYQETEPIAGELLMEEVYRLQEKYQ